MPEVRIGGLQLLDEAGPRLFRLGAHEAAFARAESQEDHLVVLAGVELEGAAIGAVGQDVQLDVGERERPMQPRRIGPGEVSHEAAEEALQIGHRSSRCCSGGEAA